MPGVTVTTATRSGPANDPTPAAAAYFVTAQFERGRTDVAQRVTSVAELEVLYGGRVSYGAGYDDLRMFFEEGGAEAYVARVVGPSATKGTRTLVDKAGTPLDTLRIDAIGAGAWSSGVTVQVSAGTAASSYKLTIVGPLDTEVYDSLITPADAVAALTASKYVRAVDLASATVAPNNQPATLAATALSAGTDDRASITASHMTGALSLFGNELGAGAVAVPGYPSSSVGDAVIAHCATSERRIALLGAAMGTDDAGYTSAAAAILGDADSEYAGLFGPWVRVPIGSGQTKLVSPEGYVAACRARAIRQAGPWEPGAGETGIARFVVGTERELTRAQGDALDAAGVSAIRTIAGTTRLYGWRSLSTDEENYALLSGRDTINAIVVAAEEAAEPHVWKAIDGKGQRTAALGADLRGVLEPIRAAGGLYERVVNGQTLDPGYSVDVGPNVNTDAVLADNALAAVIAVRVSPVGSLVLITVVKAALGANV